MEEILSIVCEVFCITIEQIRSESRKIDFVMARKAFCLLCKRYCNTTNIKIGYHISRSRIGVFHAIITAENLLFARDKLFTEKFNQIEEKIKDMNKLRTESDISVCIR